MFPFFMPSSRTQSRITVAKMAVIMIASIGILLFFTIRSFDTIIKKTNISKTNRYKDTNYQNNARNFPGTGTRR